MADNVTSGVEEIKEDGSRNNGIDSQDDRENVINEITQILNHLFDPNNLSNNLYLIQRSQGITFHIPVKYIYEEYSIKAKSADQEIINEAIERAENVIANKKGDIIESVKPKYDQLRKNITVKNIARDDENEFKQIVYGLEGAQESIVNWSLNQQLNMVTIVCKDEQSAIDLYNQLAKTQYKDAPLDISLNFENLYIIALENVKNRGRGGPGFQQNRQYNMMPQYQMQALFLSQMSNNYFKNYYPANNFYMQNPMMMQMPMNPNINGPVSRPPNQYKGSGGKRGGGSGGYYKKPRGGSRGGGYYKSDRKPTGQTKVEVNDSNFPPLSNGSPGDQ